MSFRKKFVSPLLKSAEEEEKQEEEKKKPKKLETSTGNQKDDSKKLTDSQQITKKSDQNPESTSTISTSKKKFKCPVDESTAIPESDGKKNKKNATKSTSKEENEQDEKDDDEDPKKWVYWTVMHTKQLNKKHKTFEDGVIVIKKNQYELLDDSGKRIGIMKCKTETMVAGASLRVGQRYVEFMEQMDHSKFLSGACFNGSIQSTTTKKQEILKSSGKRKRKKGEEEEENAEDLQEPPKKKISSAAVSKPFKKLVSEGSNENDEDLSKSEENEVEDIPEGAFILNPDHPQSENGKKLKTIYMDPFLVRNLREHQKEGVKFLYECIMGERGFDGCGCILADEMGLGKTLQVIALIWTLINQGKFGKAEISKAIVVTNSSLVQNWAREFKKWLGNERLKPLVCNSQGKETVSEIITNFRIGRHKVFIISYALCTRHAAELATLKCDLLVCDEGHKLKNQNIKIFQALKAISTPRKVILSGTPLQNDLNEFYCCVNFVNPAIFGDLASFKSLFADPISKSKEPSASRMEKEIGNARSEALNDLVNQFLLRRTNEILQKHLPPKKEILVFINQTGLQEKLYQHFLNSKSMYLMIEANDQKLTNALSAVQNLTKLLTSPLMIFKKLEDEKSAKKEKVLRLNSLNQKNKKKEDEEDEDLDEADEEVESCWQGAWDLFPKEFTAKNKNEADLLVKFSGKLLILKSLLEKIHEKNDKVVLVSYYTSILDQFEIMLHSMDLEFLRLDGRTNSDKRMDIVERFNTPSSKVFCLLLSSKAGGTGLNLIGANRIILFDPDWNPSNDKQAMARVHREGQKKEVFIYRFFATGTTDEKIYQRQMVKNNLSDTVVGGENFADADFKMTKKRGNTNASNVFSKDFLRDLFALKPKLEFGCETFAAEIKKNGIKNDEEYNSFLQESDEALFDVFEEFSQKNNKETNISFIKIQTPKPQEKIEEENQENEEKIEEENEDKIEDEAEDKNEEEVKSEDEEEEIDFDKLPES